MINGSTCTLSRLGSVTTTTPLSACGHNLIYVDVVFRQLYILRPVALFMWLISCRVLLSSHWFTWK